VTLLLERHGRGRTSLSYAIEASSLMLDNFPGKGTETLGNASFLPRFDVPAIEDIAKVICLVEVQSGHQDTIKRSRLPREYVNDHPEPFRVILLPVVASVFHAETSAFSRVEEFQCKRHPQHRNAILIPDFNRQFLMQGTLDHLLCLLREDESCFPYRRLEVAQLKSNIIANERPIVADIEEIPAHVIGSQGQPEVALATGPGFTQADT
jgi:hypothetical protein